MVNENVILKKSISIFLLCLYVFTAFQISEYIKLPLLVEHYIEHQQENPKLNFIEFFSAHYAQNLVVDFENHTKLPFKSHQSDCACSSIVTFCVPIQSFNFEHKLFLNEYKKPSFVYSFVFISNFQSSIWQPPKIC